MISIPRDFTISALENQIRTTYFIKKVVIGKGSFI